MNNNHVFVTLEGIDFTGKSTIIRKLKKELSDIDPKPLFTHDPPALSPWKQLKGRVFDRQSRVSAPAEAILFLAGRVDNLMRRIRPALNEGRPVIADRFADSWLAYWVPVLGELFGSSSEALTWMQDLDSWLENLDLPRPQLTYLLLDDPRTAVKRAPKKPRTKWESAEALERVQQVYLELRRREPKRFRTYDLRDSGLRVVTAQVVLNVAEYVRSESR